MHDQDVRASFVVTPDCSRHALWFDLSAESYIICDQAIKILQSYNSMQLGRSVPTQSPMSRRRFMGGWQQVRPHPDVWVRGPSSVRLGTRS
jgi:hypothetical protein